MAQVTGGVVKYARKVQKAQYEPIDAAVELTFALDEGERNFEEALDQYANEAVQKVLVMLGIAAPKPNYTVTDIGKVLDEVRAERPKDLELSGRIDMGATTMAEEPERTKADLAAEKIAEVSDPASLEPAPKRRGRPPKNNPDPAAIDPSPAAGAPAQQTEATDPAAIDPEPPSKEDGGGSATKDPAALDGAVFTAAAPEITDGELQAMIAGHNAKTQAVQAIRELIGKYTGGPPKTFRDIPQAVRAKFREELEAIKAPAS